MTLQELITDAMKRVAEGDKNRFSDDDWIRWINQGQLKIATQTLCLKKSGEITLSSGTYEYSLPADLWKVYIAFYGVKRLQEVLIDRFMTLEQTAGDPTCYAVWGGKIKFDAVPTSGGKVSLLYYSLPTKLTISDTTKSPDIPEVYHPAIVTYACYRMKQSDQSINEAGMLHQEFLKEIVDVTADMARETRDGPVWVEDVDGDFYE